MRASLKRSFRLSLLSLLPSSSRSSLNCPTRRSVDAAVFWRPRVRGGDICGGGDWGFLSPDVPLDSHENGLLNPLAIDGSGEALSEDVGGGDIALDGDIDRVV